MLFRSGWGEWSKWSSSCPDRYFSDSTQNRERLCNNPTPANGGADCEGDHSEVRGCRAFYPILNSFSVAGKYYNNGQVVTTLENSIRIRWTATAGETSILDRVEIWKTDKKNQCTKGVSGNEECYWSKISTNITDLENGYKDIYLDNGEYYVGIHVVNAEGKYVTEREAGASRDWDYGPIELRVETFISPDCEPLACRDINQTEFCGAKVFDNNCDGTISCEGSLNCPNGCDMNNNSCQPNNNIVDSSAPCQTTLRAEMFSDGMLMLGWVVNEAVAGQIDHFEVWRSKIVNGQPQSRSRVNANVDAGQRSFIDKNPDEDLYEYYMKTIVKSGEDYWSEPVRVANTRDSVLSTFYGYNNLNGDIVLKWTIKPGAENKIRRIEVWRTEKGSDNWRIVEGKNNLPANITRIEDIPGNGSYVYGLHVIGQNGSLGSETGLGLKQVNLCYPACENSCE